MSRYRDRTGQVVNDRYVVMGDIGKRTKDGAVLWQCLDRDEVAWKYLTTAKIIRLSREHDPSGRIPSYGELPVERAIRLEGAPIALLWIDAVREQEHARDLLRVAEAIAETVDSAGSEVQVSRDALAAETGLEADRIKRAVAHLERAGWLRWKRQGKNQRLHLSAPRRPERRAA